VKAALVGEVDGTVVQATTRSGVDKSGIGIRAIETPEGRVQAPTPEQVSPALEPKNVPSMKGENIPRGADAEFKLFGHTLLSTTPESKGTLFLAATAPICPSCSANTLSLRAARPGLRIIDSAPFTERARQARLGRV